MYYILNSNSLKVEDENTVLGFIFNYMERLERQLLSMADFERAGYRDWRGRGSPELDSKGQRKLRGVASLLV